MVGLYRQFRIRYNVHSRLSNSNHNFQGTRMKINGFLSGVLAGCIIASLVLSAASVMSQPTEKLPQPIGELPPVMAVQGAGEIGGVLKVRGLHIVGKDDKVVASLVPVQSGGAGLWITHPTGPMVAIYTINEQAGIGFYTKPSGDRAMPLALSLDRKTGKPTMQVYDPGDKEMKTLRHINLLDLK